MSRCVTHLRYIMLFIAWLFTFINLKAQDNEAICSKGLSYGELTSLFQIKNTEKLFTALEQKCFEIKETEDAKSRTYERQYEKPGYYSVTTYNELFIVKNGNPYQYICSEQSVCENILLKLFDNMIFTYLSPIDTNVYIYILKDKLHIIELDNIPQEKIGYAFGFKYLDITSSALKQLNEAKLADKFPKSIAERNRLEYRYERIEGYETLTTIYLNEGDKVLMEASGQISLGYFAGKGGINGIDGYESESYTPIKGFKHGSLLYKIGAADWELVPEEKTFIVKKGGNLKFMINDSDSGNNSGHFLVDIKIIKAK